MVTVHYSVPSCLRIENFISCLSYRSEFEELQGSGTVWLPAADGGRACLSAGKSDGDGKRLAAWQSMVSGGSAAILGPTVTNPFDVIKAHPPPPLSSPHTRACEQTPTLPDTKSAVRYSPERGGGESIWLCKNLRE